MSNVFPALIIDDTDPNIKWSPEKQWDGRETWQLQTQDHASPYDVEPRTAHMLAANAGGQMTFKFRGKLLLKTFPCENSDLNISSQAQQSGFMEPSSLLRAPVVMAPPFRSGSALSPLLVLQVDPLRRSCQIILAPCLARRRVRVYVEQTGWPIPNTPSISSLSRTHPRAHTSPSILSTTPHRPPIPVPNLRS
jgi:hypothetical protein